MAQKKELKLTPELKHLMIPTLRYYLNLIVLPNLELETYLRQELEKNPLLEEQSEEASSETDTLEANLKEQLANQIALKQANEFNVVELFADETNIPDNNFREQFDSLENIPAQDIKLCDDLMNQAKRVFKGEDLKIAELVISNIDEDGCLTLHPDDIAAMDYQVEQVQNIIKKIQHFDPPGCAWQSLTDSLLAQLEVNGYGGDSIEYILVKNHLRHLSSNHWEGIVKELNIDEERFLKAREIIMKLEPRPARKYANAAPGYISPDFIIEWRDNKLVAHFADENCPRVRLRSQYIEILQHPDKVPADELLFIKQKAQSAQNLIFAIEQRKRTLTRIIEGILEYQYNFFEKSYQYLKPLTMTEFAKQLGVNTSTVSRAILNKYVESPRGIHKLRFFFSAAISHMDKRIIFQKIREIIATEDQSSPLSDNQIAKRLARQKIIISRRTIAKYRELLGISATQYRQHKTSGL